MKKVIVVILSAFTSFAYAQQHLVKSLTDEERKAIAERRKAYFSSRTKEQILLERTGGLITKPNTGEGLVLFVNSQTNCPTTVIRKYAEELELFFRIRIRVTELPKPSLSEAPKVVAQEGAKIGIFIVSDGDLPKSLVAYDEGFGFANVAKLNSAEGKIYEGRVKKLVFRTMALACGLADAQQIGSTMWPAPDDVAFDALWLPNIPLPNLMIPIVKHLDRLGVKQTTVTTYRKACEQGWAPAPTNDVQKKIWDKVHATPEKPLKISYDKDRQKPVVK